MTLEAKLRKIAKENPEMRRYLVPLLKNAATPKVAVSKDTQDFVDWVFTTRHGNPIGVGEVEAELKKMGCPLLASKGGVKGPRFKKGDTLWIDFKLSKANPDVYQGQEVHSGVPVSLLDYDCTKVDCIDATGTSVTIRTKDKTELLCPWGQKPKGIPLYKYFEPSLIQAKTPPLEIVYLAGLEADDEQKVVAQNYIARGEAKGEKRSLNYYSGFSYGYRFGQNGMYFEVLAQQRFQMDGTTCGKRPSYGVRSFNPSLGQVLYIGTIGKRPHEWKDELEALKNPPIQP